MRKYKGIVRMGFKRAAALGFPTVNIPLADAGVSGIYAALVKVGGAEYRAAAYADQNRKVLEAHMLDQNLDLYGKEIAITLLKKIRESKAFESDAMLRSAILDDVRKVREHFDRSI